MKNKIVLDGIVGWDITAQSVREQLEGMTGEVTVEISSPGGSIFEGVTIFNLLRDYEGEVTTIITGIAASMASYIALAGKTIKAYDNAVYMIHNAWTVSYGDHRDLRKDADILDGLTNMLSKKYAEATGLDNEAVRLMMDEESYFYGSEIVENGFATEIVPTEGEDDKTALVALAKSEFDTCTSKVSKLDKAEEKDKLVALFGSQPKGTKSMKQSENNLSSKKGETMDLSTVTLEALNEGNPNLVASIKALGFEDGKKEGISTGALAEGERINAINALDSKGHTEVIAEALADPTMSIDDVKLKLFDADAQATKDRKDAHSKDGESLAKLGAELNGGQAENKVKSDEDKADELMENANKKARGEQ